MKVAASDSFAEPKVRQAEMNDMEEITSIYNYYVEHGTATYETDPISVEEMTQRWAAQHEQGYPYLVASCNSKIAGYAYVRAYNTRAAYRNTVENSVYVDPSFVGRQIGTALLGNLIEACTAIGYRQVVAVVGDTANEASIRLHESQGFRIVGSLTSVGYKHGQWLSTVILQRSIGDGDKTPAQP
ncbi:GNAT family N-acetyltransferase [Lipomyces orientalis]|uniref:GNAT family N-acetyltransferase n=1 Tax=Lipomyces orientalis TaxID=1233043 RepID=A0ACC3TLK7_9ASCO